MIRFSLKDSNGIYTPKTLVRTVNQKCEVFDPPTKKFALRDALTTAFFKTTLKQVSFAFKMLGSR